MRFTFRNKCRVKEITPDPRRQRFLAERCGPRPSSTSSALTLPHTDDHRSHILPPLLFKHPRRNSPQYRFSAIGRNSPFNEFANPNSSHYTLRLTHVCSPDQAGLNAGCTGWLAPVKAIDMRERNGDQEARSAAPVYVLVRLPGPPGAAEGGRRGRGGGETTRSCTHGGEHYLTEAPDECRAASLVGLTCAHVRTRRFSSLACVRMPCSFPSAHAHRCTILD